MLEKNEEIPYSSFEDTIETRRIRTESFDS
jgi:hypothetical protein